MAWVLYIVPSTKKADAEAALRDDIVSRQSHKVRDAPAAGGPAGHLYILVEGSQVAVDRAHELLKPLGDRLEGKDGEALHARFKEEDDSASAGMGLFFTE
jgi:3-hydroxyisobutyrate dehydrogenase-like beta-hydroxyacid dehydrogenase